MKTIASKRMLALLVTVLLLLSSVGLVACESSSGSDDSTTEGDGPAVSYNDKEYVPNVPEGTTFNDATFSVLSLDPGMYASSIVQFDFEEDQEDVVDAAIFKRNRRIEADYRIVFDSEYCAIEEATPALQEQILADEDTYKLIMMISREAFGQSLEGNVMPYSSLPHVDMSQPWYMTKVNDEFSIYGYNVLAYTDECINGYMQSTCIFFNMDIVNNNSNIENPYDLVQEDNWTQEKFYELANNAKSNINDSSVFSADDGDIFGVIAEGDNFYTAMWIGAEVKTIEKDKRDMPMYTATTNERLIDVLEILDLNLKMEGFYCNTWSQFSDVVGGGDSQREAAMQYFSEGGGLFRVGTVGQIQLLRSMEADFGIVPLPKYDDSQETYYSRFIDGWLHVVPSSVRATEMTGVILEALGAESKNLVIPAFFDVALDNKYVRDEDIERTREMLDIIFNNVTMDLGETAWQNYIRNPILSAIESGDGAFSSTLAGITTIAEEQCINLTLEKIVELQAGMKD